MYFTAATKTVAPIPPPIHLIQLMDVRKAVMLSRMLGLSVKMPA